MKRILITLFLLICLPVQAEQFRQFGTEIVNRNMVTHVKLNKYSIEIFYSAGNGYSTLFSTIIKTENYTDKMKKFNEIKQWLNSKD